MHDTAIKIYELLNKIRNTDLLDLWYDDLIHELCSYHEEELRKDFVENCQATNNKLLNGTKEQFEIEFQSWLRQNIVDTYRL